MKYVTVNGTNIPYGAFHNVNKLSRVTLTNATKVGQNTFKNCSALVKMNEGLVEISEEAFKNCGAATITIPNSVTTIKADAFSSMPNLTSVTFGANLENIQYRAFEGCTKLSTVTFNTTKLTYIGGQMFKGCTSLATIVIPNTVTEIQDGAFEGCTKLSNVTIPKGISHMSSNIFTGCTLLTELTFLGTKAEWSTFSTNTGWTNGGATNLAVVHCSDGDINL